MVNYAGLSEKLLNNDNGSKLVPASTPVEYLHYVEELEDRLKGSDIESYFMYKPCYIPSKSNYSSIPTSILVNMDYMLYPGLLKMRSDAFMLVLLRDNIVDYLGEGIYVPKGASLADVVDLTKGVVISEEMHLMQEFLEEDILNIPNFYKLFTSFPAKAKFYGTLELLNKPSEINSIRDKVVECIIRVTKCSESNAHEIVEELGLNTFLSCETDVTRGIEKFNIKLRNYLEDGEL